MSAALHIRPAEATDHPAFVRLFAELEIDDPTPPEGVWVRELLPDSLVAEEGGRVVGYGLAHAYRGAAHVVHLAVDRASRRRGVGLRLLLALAERLRGAGCSEWRLNVKAGNDPAIQLYARLGFEVRYRSAVLRVPWRALEALPRPAAPLATVEPAAEEDAELERVHDLLPGQLGRYRSRTGDVLLRLADPAEPARQGLGLARFVPAFPGSFPFRVAEPEQAVVLLEALRPHAPPESPAIFVVTEGDERLEGALRAAGAVRRFETLHLRGAIPTP